MSSKVENKVKTDALNVDRIDFCKGAYINSAGKVVAPPTKVFLK